MFNFFTPYKKPVCGISELVARLGTDVNTVKIRGYKKKYTKYVEADYELGWVIRVISGVEMGWWGANLGQIIILKSRNLSRAASPALVVQPLLPSPPPLTGSLFGSSNDMMAPSRPLLANPVAACHTHTHTKCNPFIPRWW